VLEDLHWVDDASLQLISYLTRELSSLPVMLVATCTTEGAGPGASNVYRLLEELRATGAAMVMELAPLTNDDAAQLVGSALGGSLQSRDVELIKRPPEAMSWRATKV
jgi:predicted ATPase